MCGRRKEVNCIYQNVDVVRNLPHDCKIKRRGFEECEEKKYDGDESQKEARSLLP